MYSTSFACKPHSVSHCSLPVSIKRLHFLPSTARAVASIAFMASDNLGFEEIYAIACLHRQVQGSASAHPHWMTTIYFHMQNDGCIQRCWTAYTWSTGKSEASTKAPDSVNPCSSVPDNAQLVNHVMAWKSSIEKPKLWKNCLSAHTTNTRVTSCSQQRTQYTLTLYTIHHNM